MPEKEIKGVLRGPPINNNLISDNKYFSDNNNPIKNLPEKFETPPIPYFRQKPAILMADGFILFFKEVNKIEYWICEQQKRTSFLVQWMEKSESKLQKFHRNFSNRNGLDVENKTRDNSLVRILKNRIEIEKTEILEYLEEVGIFIGENRILLSPHFDEIPENAIPSLDVPDKDDEISEERREELIELLKRPDLLSFIDQALYEKSPDTGFIIGEVESKHILNFNCIGARLGVSTINTLKGASSIGKTNTANVVTGLHRTKKVGSLSDTALKYATDMDKFDILYIQETLEDEFKNKETRLMSADDGGFIAETTIKNPDTGLFEVQQTTIPVKTLVTTTTAIELDPEFATRNFIIPVDDSEEQTIRILEENFKHTKKKLQKRNGEINFNYKYNQLKDAYNLLEPYDVLIPFETDLMDIFPTSNPQTRRDSKKLIKLIEESALLFQYQRCRSQADTDPILVASWVDLAHAVLLGGPILEATLTGFDKRLLDTLPIIYELIDYNGYVTTKSLYKKIKKSSKYSWEILKFFEENGYIYHDIDTKRSHGIKGKMKVYIKTGAKEYKSLLLATGNINWAKLKTKEEEFIKKQIRNSSHQVGHVIHLPKFDLTVPNKVMYLCTSIYSEEFGIYSGTFNALSKTSENDREILIRISRNRESDNPIKQAVNAEIDYKNLTGIESAILSELVSLMKHTYRSIVDTLKPTYSENEITQTLGDMEQRGWIE